MDGEVDVARSDRAGARWVAAVAALLLVAGCELRVTTEVAVDRDGSGRVGLGFALDDEMLAELDAVGVDPAAELTAAVAATSGWEVARDAAADGLTVTATTTAADPAAITDALRELTAGLSEDDPAVEVDLALDVDDEGAATVRGTARLRPPAGPGVIDGDDDRDRMLALTREAVDASLVVTLPGRILDHDADDLDGRTLTWQLPADGTVTLEASAAAPGPFTPQRIAALVGAMLVLLAAGGVVWVWRRR